MALDPLAQLVPDRAQPEFGLERLECSFQFSQPPVSTNRLLNAPLRVAGAQDIMARSGIVRVIRRIARTSCPDPVLIVASGSRAFTPST